MQKNESKEMIIAATIYGSISFLFGLCGIWWVISARDKKYLKDKSNIPPLIYDSIGGFLGWSLLWPFMVTFLGFSFVAGKLHRKNESS